MSMKLVFACLMFLSLSIVSVYAQDQAPSAEDIVAKMQSKLSLTPDQVTAITPIIEKYTSKREVLHQGMEDGTADRDSMRSQMKQLRTDEAQELSQILSADQLSQWQQMQKQHRHSSDSSGGGSAEGGSENHEGSSGSGD